MSSRTIWYVVDLCGVNKRPPWKSSSSYPFDRIIRLADDWEDFKHPGEPKVAERMVQKMLQRLGSGSLEKPIRSGKIKIDFWSPSDNYALANLVASFKRRFGTCCHVSFAHVTGGGTNDHKWKVSRRRIRL